MTKLRLEARLGCKYRYNGYLRRGRESNPRIEVLQTPTLPLGYPAACEPTIIECSRALCQRDAIWPVRYGAGASAYLKHEQQLAQIFSLRAQKRIPGGVNSPVRAFRGLGGSRFSSSAPQGANIWDVDGNEYIDYVGTWGPAILGHAPQVVIEAVRDAARARRQFWHSESARSGDGGTDLRWVPSIEKVRMVNSGTEATMSCLRLARGFTGRDKIIKFEGCYHGHVDSLLVKAGSGALTHGQPDSAGVPADFAALTISLPFNDIEAVRAAFRENARADRRHHSRTDPGQRRTLFSARRFSQAACATNARKHGALLIFDEVMTGFRVARGGAQELYGIRPDLTALGKVIGGGLPVGAFGGRAEIMDQLSPLGPVYQAGTLSGNPLAMAAGLAQLRELERIDGWKLLEELGAQFEEATRRRYAI